MKIVVLDGHALNPGDLSWAGLDDDALRQACEVNLMGLADTPAES